MKNLESIGSHVDDLGTQPTLVAIGNFDGVHRGHQAVLAETARRAHQRKLVPVALTFEPHPTQAVGRPAPACLTPVQRKVELIERIDPALRVVVQHFDALFAAQSPEQFVQNVLVDQLHAAGVRVGENFRFGARRSGNLRDLDRFGAKHGFQAQVAPLLGDEGGRFSSTRARKAVAEGDLATVLAVLTRPHALSGRVVEGQKRARTLGFPTANLRWVAEALPPHGVYVVAVDRIDDDHVGHRVGVGVCNIGIRPTVDAGFAVEVHLFDFEGDLYGASLRVHLIEHLRPEKKFDGLDQLREQIAIDAKAARAALSSVKPAAGAGQAWF